MAAAARVRAEDLDTVLAPPAGTRTIAVLGASYAGHRAVQVIAPTLPAGWRIVVLERNTHAPHLYAFPRMTVVSGHEPKVFIPYDRLFAAARNNLLPPAKGGHALIQASITAVQLPSASASTSAAENQADDPTVPTTAASSPDSPANHDHQVDTSTMTTTRGQAASIAFRLIDPQGNLGEQKWLQADFIVYALGSELSDPINAWASQTAGSPSPYNGSKSQGIQFLQRAQGRIQSAKSILVVGGGALGVQLAGDIAERYPEKEVTLTHSRNLLPRFDPWMHEQASQHLERLGVKLILGSRADLGSISPDQKSLRLQNGQQLTADLIVRVHLFLVMPSPFAGAYVHGCRRMQACA